MTAESPAPDSPGARTSENPQVVETGVTTAFPTPVNGEALDLIQHVLQIHDRADRDMGGRGEAGGEHLHGQ